MKKSKNWLKVAAGAAVGVVVGLLTAPKSGRETRRDIKKKALHLSSEAEKRLKKLYKHLIREANVLETKSRHLQGQAKKEIGEAIKKARFISERVKQMISDIRDGLADQDEVDKAIAAGEKAQEDLRPPAPPRCAPEQAVS